MKHFFGTFIIFLFSISGVNAQNVTGRITDEKGAPLGFVNITLVKNQDSSRVASAISGKTGEFTVNATGAGTYFLRMTSIGFKEKKTEAFDIGTGKDLGTISLTQESKTLQDVNIISMRPMITQKADRMIVSVEGTAMASGSNAYAVLSKAPGVFIDQEGNIQLNGKSGVTVMIDGRRTYLSARDLRTMLEGMNAENLKNIEIITNPSAKYDAEGTSGILNINLKKNTQNGMNGSLYTGYSYNFKQHGYTYGGNINYKSGRWNSFLNLDGARRVGGREATFTRIFYSGNKTTYFDQVATGNFVGTGPPAVRLGSDYSFNTRHTVGFMANYTTNTADQDFLTDTYIGEAPKTPSRFVDANNYSTNTYSNFTGNLHYNGKLDSVGSLIAADLDYVKITNRGHADYYNYFTTLSSGQKTQDIQYQNTPSGYDIYSAKFDLTLPVNKTHKFETGAKASRVVSDNDFRFYFNNNGLVLDPQRTNHFYYTENIYAAYLNWAGDLSKKISLQLGLRGEETVSKGISYTTGQVTERDYFNLFPSVFVQQKVNDNYGINYSYSRRLTRPNYGNLNPFRAYRDPYTWYEGNPFLKPQYSHSFGLTQIFKKLYTVALNYLITKDVMAEIPVLDVANAVTVYTTGNVNNGRTASMSAVGPLKISKWWDTQNTLILAYNKFSMNSNLGLVVNDQLFAMVQTNHTILLPRQVRMEMNFILRGPAASGLYRIASMHRLDIAFKRSLFNKKFDLTLNANDIFKGFRYLWTTNIAGNINDFDQYFRFRSIGMSLRYNFSKGQKVDLKRRSSIDELNRTGG